MPKEAIIEFVSAYTREIDFYQAAARLCSQQCENLLAARGVRAIVTHRAKKAKQLFVKLLQRDSEKNYKSAKEIREDISDLAGVRIALYFPGDRGRVASIIKEAFDVGASRQFPLPEKRFAEKRFGGYYADHYRVQFRETDLNEAQASYGSAKIEIQVGSVLMHAWAEVEHDLIYKPESGALSEDEHAILDELNGMVIAGEVALERLQRAVERRLSQSNVKFDNHFELAAYLHKFYKPAGASVEPQLGRVDLLWELLKKAEMDSVSKLSAVLEKLGNLTTNDGAISDQIVDQLFADNPDLYAYYNSLKSNLPLDGDYSDQPPTVGPARTVLIGEFFNSWIVLETVLNIIRVKTLPNGQIASRVSLGQVDTLPSLAIFSPEVIEVLRGIRVLRNNLIHGSRTPGREEIREATTALKRILENLSNHKNAVVRAAVEDASKTFAQND